jgi:thiol-disulfide isomerase/thioredoxin
MSGSPARWIRLALLGVLCATAGYYAGSYLWSQRESKSVSPPVAMGELVTTLPEFTLADLDGQPRAIRDWSDRALVINFWATWCAPCRREMPLLDQLQAERQGDNFEVIGIAVDRLADVEAYLAESGVTYPILVGQQDAMEAAEQFGPGFLGLPFTIFTAPGGSVLKFHAGELHLADLRQIMRVVDQVIAGRLPAADARRRLDAL